MTNEEQEKIIANLKQNAMLRWLVATTKELAEAKEKIAKEAIEKFKKEKEAKVVNVDIRHQKLFEVAQKAYVYIQYGMKQSFLDLIYEIDSVDDVDEIPSVTPQNSKESYGTIKVEGADSSSYEALSRVTLLEHIEDIVDLVIKAYESNEKDISASRAATMCMLAFLHDVGKILPLMKKRKYNYVSTTHEERSKMFFDDFFKEKKYGDIEMRFLERVRKVLDVLDGNKENANIDAKRFMEFDHMARTIELHRIIEEEQKEKERKRE